MNKILAEVFVPAVQLTYDVYLPCELQLNQTIQMLNKISYDLSDKAFIFNQQTVLCDRNTGSILNINMSVANLGLQNGSRLMLI